MSVTLMNASAAEPENGEQRFVIERVSRDAYLKISDALDDQPGLRMIYCDGRLVFVGKSRRREWLSKCLGHLVLGIASELGTWLAQLSDWVDRVIRPRLSGGV